MFIAVLLMMKRWTQPKHSPTDEWENKMSYPFNGVEFGQKRNEVLRHAPTQMNLEDTRLSERCQSQENIYYMKYL